MASGHASRINRPNTWLLRPDCDVKKVLANTEPSTHGTKQTLSCLFGMSAFRGKADIKSRAPLGLLPNPKSERQNLAAYRVARLVWADPAGPIWSTETTNGSPYDEHCLARVVCERCDALQRNQHQRLIE
jgi:hypothetical protein